ncbi:hypothetical protein EDB89DRAFT_2077388 [Lactarius sanguifluus]|nr:hypothetical protein EDB89DRAFT_2077388 [Lactarius sanguifluus]
MHSPSTIVDISIFHLDIPRRRMTPLLPCYISHGSRTPSLSPPSGIGQRASIISEPDKACTDLPVSPSFPRMSEMFPSIPTYIVPTHGRTTLALRASTRPRTTHLIVLALALALQSMHALSSLTLTTFDANLLAAALGTLTHLTLLADPLPYASFDDFLAESARLRLTHLALPHFVGVPP